MKYKYRAAPCLLTSRKTTIGEAMKLMDRRGTSYVLVVDDRNTILGIFTRGDVFRKFDQLRDADQLTKPVSDIATAPVKTITADLIHKAPNVMISGKISHKSKTQKYMH